MTEADMVVVLPDHQEFDYGMVSAHARPVLDTRHRLSPAPNVEYL